MMNDRDFIIGVLLALIIIGGAIYYIVPEFQKKPYMIQDVELWCGKNPDANVSPTGENCSQLTFYRNIWNNTEDR